MKRFLEYISEQMTTPDNPAPTYRDTPPGGPPDLLPDPIGSDPRDRDQRRNPGKGKDFQEYYKGRGWGEGKYGVDNGGGEGWDKNGYPVCLPGGECRDL